METSPYLIVQQLIVHGKSKLYISKFEEGLNLIWGDLDSGKSSILNLIDYCMGGGNKHLLYEEMASHGRIALLEVDLNGSVFTLERDILNEDSPIKVHTGAFDGRFTTFPMLMSASSAKEMPDGWISDFILDTLGIPKVKIKESRLREDSDSDRLSFRDLMKLLYLKQTRVGSDALLDYTNPSVFNKNVEIQKFVFNIHDDNLATLQSDLAAELNEQKELGRSELFIRKFLQDVAISVDKLEQTHDEVERQESRINEIDEAVEAVKRDFALSTDVGLEISNSVGRIRNEIDILDQTLVSIEIKYENYVKLSNTYRFDLDAINLSKLSRSVMQISESENRTVPCPLCATELTLSSAVVEDDDLDHQIKSLKNRDAGIQTTLTRLREQQQESLTKKGQLTSMLKEATRGFDENNITNISPLISAIQALETSKTALKVELAQAERNSAIAHKFKDIGLKLDIKTSLISNLRRAIKAIQDGLVGLDEVIEALTKLLNIHMQKSGLQKVSNVYFDKKFIAHFRGISYYNTSSGGVRTITSIATFVSRLKYLLVTPSNLPSFLMIDTPGQNIGRYRANDDDSEVSDPKIYENIFKQIVEVTEHAREKGRKCQVIIVDNDMPESLIEGVNFHLVKRFSKQGGEFEKGLISDA
ncbi:hypothetical protein RCH06_000906 [Polaromonas sp. CG_9.5]|uniref:AAA family ATPase n=1 Tax=Polaromonas sp. CG_9.5 TaxID=3071705 RepID=UPI002E028EC9|nr:hypothetical protein [Polaromonas sp. CG_9.5]